MSMANFFSQLKVGQRLYIPGASAEPRAFVEALAQVSAELPPLNITNSFVPGVNPLALATEDNALTETVVFPRGNKLMHEGRVDFLPLSYFGAANYLQQQSFDWAVLQLSPPDQQGQCSLGASVEFLPSVLKGSQRLLGLINPNVPQVLGAPSLSIKELHQVEEIDSPLVTYNVGSIDRVSDQIAGHLSELIESGAVLQLGLGNVPTKLCAALGEFKQLRFHSGMLSDGFWHLAECGALDEGFAHTTCSALGSDAFYQQLPHLQQLTIRGVNQTHDPSNLSQHTNLISINSALEVDLWGQANLEMLGSRQISSVGGAADFARAARNAPQGKSVIALPSTAAKGKLSRIVPHFQPGQVTSLGRGDIDYVVTEHGVAELKGKSSLQRAQALIQIADPAFREQLSEAWHQQLSKS
jgi:4-hydroxybutyrate CoA-transferase